MGSDGRAVGGPDAAVRGRPVGRPPVTRPQGGRRRLLLVCVTLLGGAAALQGAARLPWFTATVDAVGRGTVAVTATGADLVPALSAVGLLAVAAVAAAVALAGPARRVLGGLVGAAGILVVVTAAGLLLAPPAPADLAALPGAPLGGAPVAGSVTRHVGPLVALLGASLLTAAGGALLLGERGLLRLGARYAARPVRTAGTADPVAPATGPIDADRAAWDALDAGRDPTAAPAVHPRPTDARERTDGGAAGRAV
jgi:uncharacterized membrane protein (TIGR02234 family)